MHGLILVCCLLSTSPADKFIVGAVPPMVQAELPTPPKAVQNEYSLTVWTADWCVPCKSMKPWLTVLYNEGYPIMFADVEKYRVTADGWGVKVVPTLILHNAAGIEVGRIVGWTDETTVRDWLRKANVAKSAKLKKSVPRQKIIYENDYLPISNVSEFWNYPRIGGDASAGTCGPGGCPDGNCPR